MRTLLPTLLTLALATGIRAQQDPMYTMYQWNIMAVNPGYAAHAHRMSFTALSRMQWVGVDGAPNTQNLVMRAPLKNHPLGVGGSIIRDRIGPMSTISLKGDLAYRFRSGPNSRMALGLNAGMTTYQADLASVPNTDPNDPQFQRSMPASVAPNFGFGVYQWTKKGYWGFSVPRLLETDLTNSQEGGGAIHVSRQVRHYFLMGGYVFKINRDLRFRPSMLVRAVAGAPLSADINATFLFSEKLWLGVSYRTQDSFSALTSIQVSDNLKVGYAYDMPISRISRNTMGSHELMLSYDMPSGYRRIRSPRYF
jgi:type IX secretion system PorP/SprF family membrane protein